MFGLKDRPRAADLLRRQEMQAAEFLVEHFPASRNGKLRTPASYKKRQQLIDAVISRDQWLVDGGAPIFHFVVAPIVLYDERKEGATIDEDHWRSPYRTCL